MRPPLHTRLRHRWQNRHGLVWLFRRRLFWRFYLTLLASLMVVVMLGGLIWHIVAESTLPPGYDLDARITQLLLPPPGAPGHDIEAVLGRIAKHLRARVALIGPDGRLIDAQGLSDDPNDASRVPDDARVPPGRSFRALRIDLPDGRVLVARGLHLIDRPPLGFYYLCIAALGVGIASFPFVRRITRRLEGLRHAVETWGEGHLDTRVPERGHDEIATVARTFNVAAARIEHLVSAHRTLLAHASHELRSPLARLRMAIEVFQTAPSDALKATIEHEIGELDQLVDEILLSSRLDHAGLGTERETVDLLGLAAEEAARVDAQLVATGRGPFLVTGSQRLLRRLIRNLLENARRHGAPPIEITLERRAATGSTGAGQMSAWIHMEVTDHGPGIAEAERTRVFEPFYRPSGTSESGGSWGLGLALVARIAAGHHGRVACEAASGGGARFVVDLPVSGPDASDMTRS